MPVRMRGLPVLCADVALQHGSLFCVPRCAASVREAVCVRVPDGVHVYAYACALVRDEGMAAKRR